MLVPLMMLTLLLVSTLSYISASRNVSTVALLATSMTRPLSLSQLEMMVQGKLRERGGRMCDHGTLDNWYHAHITRARVASRHEELSRARRLTHVCNLKEAGSTGHS